MSVKISNPDLIYANSYRDALIEAALESRHPAAVQAMLDDVPAEINRLKNLKYNKPDWPVPPQSYFWLVDGENYLGTAVIRHRATGRFPGMESHIYFEIRPSERGKGHGNKILALALAKADELGLIKVLVTAEAANHASIAVIKRNGGKLIDRRLVEEEGRRFEFLRFIIPIAA